MMNLRHIIVFTAFLAFVANPAGADQVQMLNGDRYMGKVLSLNADTLVLENEMLGTLKLPRSKVSTITLGSLAVAATNVAPAAPKTNAVIVPPVSTNASSELAAALRQLQTSTNKPEASALPGDHTALLDAAGPEARSKFNELLTGLMSGKLSMNDIRAQARSIADQARSLKGDLDEDSAASLDAYLAILDKFLGETSPKADARPAAPPKPAKP